MVIVIHTGKQLTACGSALLSLPHLSQLSGSCALFESGLKDELKGWRVSAYKRGLMTSKNLPKDWIANELKMWSRFRILLAKVDSSQCRVFGRPPIGSRLPELSQ